MLKRKALVACELVGMGTAVSLLPCLLIDLAFGCDLAGVLVVVMLLAVAGTAILTALAVHENWIDDHVRYWTEDSRSLRRERSSETAVDPGRTPSTSPRAIDRTAR